MKDERLTTKRIQEIIKKQKKHHDMFNWCEEYKDWVSSGVHHCVSMEWEYILKKSYEDREAPFSAEDLDYFDCDKAREHLTYEYNDDEDRFLEATETKNKKQFEKYINELDKTGLKDLFLELRLDDSECDAEVYEWWIVSDPVKYELEQQGEIIFEGAWGRCTTGQMFVMDGCMMNAFIDRITRWLPRKKEVKK